MSAISKTSQRKNVRKGTAKKNNINEEPLDESIDLEEIIDNESESNSENENKKVKRRNTKKTTTNKRTKDTKNTKKNTKDTKVGDLEEDTEDVNLEDDIGDTKKDTEIIEEESEQSRTLCSDFQTKKTTSKTSKKKEVKTKTNKQTISRQKKQKPIMSYEIESNEAFEEYMKYMISISKSDITEQIKYQEQILELLDKHIEELIDDDSIDANSIKLSGTGITYKRFVENEEQSKKKTKETVNVEISEVVKYKKSKKITYNIPSDIDTLYRFFNLQLLNTVNIYKVNTSNIVPNKYNKLFDYCLINDAVLPKYNSITYDIREYIEVIKSLRTKKYNIVNIFKNRGTLLAMIDESKRIELWNNAKENIENMDDVDDSIEQIEKVIEIWKILLNNDHIRNIFMNNAQESLVFKNHLYKFLDIYYDANMELFNTCLKDISWLFIPSFYSYKAYSIEQLHTIPNDIGIYDPTTNAWIDRMK